MADRSGERQSQLYLLRIWVGPGAAGGRGCRGKLQPVLGDESFFFAGPDELVALLTSLLARAGGDEGSGASGADVPPARPES